MRDEDDYHEPERRRRVHITESQIDEIARKAAEIAVRQFTDDMYKSVGKTVISKALTLIGIVAVGLYGLAVARGWVKF